jgi:hypothetical protein
MKRRTLFGAVVLLGTSMALTTGAQSASAQGPAGVGAAEAAQGDSHGPSSLNPLNWIKRDSKNTATSSETRTDVEKKLTPKLQAQGLLGTSATLTDACTSFAALDECLATLHASHNLGLDFTCLRANVTGVHTSTDVSGCKFADGEKAQGLTKAIRHFKPDANAKQASKDAEEQARSDLKTVGV